MPIVEMPNGDRVQFPDDMPKEQIRDMIASKFPELRGSPKQQEPELTGYVRAEPAENTETRDGSGVLEKIDAGVRGAADMMTFGFADEISAGLGTGFGYLGDYEKELARQRGIDRFDEKNNAYSRLGGQIAGGVTGGIGMAKSGATLLTKKALQQGGKQALARAAGEGAAYGGAYGLGSGEGTEDRLKRAGAGAVTGAVTGGVIQGAGNALATRSASRAAARAAPALDELKTATDALYKQSRDAGVMIRGSSTSKLANNLKMAAGRLNAQLRPNTAGVVDDLDSIAGQPMSLEQLDELRQVIGNSIKRAQPQDQRTLMRMKEMVDSFSDSIKPGDITGDIRGFDFIKQARAINARKAKTELVENIIDMAKVDGSGQYTQSGMANAVRREMKSLYKKIQKGREKGFSADEVELIRKMAAGKTSGAVMRLFAKFAPRGVVSFGVGQGVGTMIPGGNILVPGVGHFAAKNVDNAMVGAVDALRTSAASGQMPVGAIRGVGTAATRPLIAPSAMEMEAMRGQLTRPRQGVPQAR